MPSKARYWIEALGRRLFHHATVFTYRLDLTHLGGEPLSTQLPMEIRKVNEQNVDDASSMEPPQKLRRFRLFLHNGDRGYYAYHNGKVIHRSWIQFGPRRVQRHHMLLPFSLGEGEAYIHFCETAPTARGQGVYPAVLRRILHDLQSDGQRTCFIAVTRDNVRSQRGIEKTGFTRWQITRVLTICLITFRSTQQP